MTVAERSRREARPDEETTNRRQVEVLVSLTRRGASGATADEVAAALRLPPYVVRPRITELRQLGLVVETGERRRNGNDRRVTVWRAVLNVEE